MKDNYSKKKGWRCGSSGKALEALNLTPTQNTKMLKNYSFWMMNLGRKTNSSIKQSQFSYCVFPSFFF
jgi:hypothetical protein